MARSNRWALKRPSWQTLRRPVMLGLGYTFLVLGVLGMFLPILQGFLFLAIGLAILARHAAWARLLRMRLVARYPKLGARLRHADEVAHRWLRRLKEWWRSLVAELRVRAGLARWRIREAWRGAECRVLCWLRRVAGFVRR